MPKLGKVRNDPRKEEGSQARVGGSVASDESSEVAHCEDSVLPVRRRPAMDEASRQHQSLPKEEKKKEATHFSARSSRSSVNFSNDASRAMLRFCTACRTAMSTDGSDAHCSGLGTRSLAAESTLKLGTLERRVEGSEVRTMAVGREVGQALLAQVAAREGEYTHCLP